MPTELVRIPETGEDWPTEIEWRGQTFRLRNELGVLEYRVARGWLGGFWAGVTSLRPFQPSDEGAQAAPRKWFAMVGLGESADARTPRLALAAAWRNHLKKLREMQTAVDKVQDFTAQFGQAV